MFWGEGSQGSEGTEKLIGRLFGYGALVQAGRCREIPVAVRVAEGFVGVLRRKSFLREAAAEALLGLLEGLKEKTLAKVLRKAEGLQGLLRVTPDEATPEVQFASFLVPPPLPQNLDLCLGYSIEELSTSCSSLGMQNCGPSWVAVMREGVDLD
jgi:hypothetical protein